MGVWAAQGPGPCCQGQHALSFSQCQAFCRLHGAVSTLSQVSFEHSSPEIRTREPTRSDPQQWVRLLGRGVPTGIPLTTSLSVVASEVPPKSQGITDHRAGPRG